MNEITLGFELSALFLTAAYLVRLIFQAIEITPANPEPVTLMPFEKRSLLHQRVYEREALSIC